MKKIIYCQLFFLCFALLFSCHNKKKAAAENPSAEAYNRDFENAGYAKAIVIYYELDGCQYMLQLADEKKLEPANLSAEFQKDQLPVWIKYTFRKNAASVCMAGQLVELTDIRIRK